MQLRRKNIEGEDAECNRWTCKGRFVSIQCTVAVLKHSRGRCRAASSVPRLCHPHENRGIHCGQTQVWFKLRDRRHDQSRLKLLPIYTHIPQSTRPRPGWKMWWLYMCGSESNHVQIAGSLSSTCRSYLMLLTITPPNRLYNLCRCHPLLICITRQRGRCRLHRHQPGWSLTNIHQY